MPQVFDDAVYYGLNVWFLFFWVFEYTYVHHAVGALHQRCSINDADVNINHWQFRYMNSYSLSLSTLFSLSWTTLDCCWWHAAVVVAAAVAAEA